MKWKEFEKGVPWFPLSVLLFYLLLMLFWRLEIIPPPEEMILFLERVIGKAGMFGILIVTFLEGLAFIGHEFPGMTIILISLVVSSSNLAILASIVATISLGLTLSCIVNYWAGSFFGKNKTKQKKVGDEKIEKTLFISALHPTFLSLYFFHRGINKKGLRDVIFVPLVTFPYGLAVALIISKFSFFIRHKLLPSDLFFLGVFLVWFVIEVITKNKDFVKNKIKSIKNKKKLAKK